MTRVRKKFVYSLICISCEFCIFELKYVIAIVWSLPRNNSFLQFKRRRNIFLRSCFEGALQKYMHHQRLWKILWRNSYLETKGRKTGKYQDIQVILIIVCQNIRRKNWKKMLSRIVEVLLPGFPTFLFHVNGSVFSRRFSSEKCPTITVASFFSFFRQTTISLWLGHFSYNRNF